MCPTGAGPMSRVDATPGVPGIHESGARPCEHQFGRRPRRQHPLDLFTHKLRCFSMNKLIRPFFAFGSRSAIQNFFEIGISTGNKYERTNSIIVHDKRENSRDVLEQN